ncbi:hypothetical protein D3C86_1403470 [compost metagenome]
MPQHLLGQFGLAITQPGLLLQATGAGLLRGEVGTVALGQVEQIPAADVGQQCTDTGDEHDIKADAPDGRAPYFLVARGAQLLLHVDHVFELFADLVGQAFALPGLDRAAIVPAGALQIDHGRGVSGPFILQGLQPVQAIGLHRVIRRQFEQGPEGDCDPWLRRFVGLEELLIAGEQEPAHPGLQIDGQFYRFIGVIDHPVGVLDPLDHRHQISDQ